MCERTQEFMQLVNKAVPSSSSSRKALEVPKTKTAFNEAASEVAKGVHKTSALLTKLTNLVRRQGLFDDPTDEINSLIFRIKQDLDDLNAKCDSAQQYIDSKKSMFGESKDQSSNHNKQVVNHLKTDLMHATKGFKTILEVRSSKMKDQQVRKVELTGKGMLSPTKLLKEQAAKQESAKKGSFLHGNANENSLTVRTPSSKRPPLPSPYGIQPYDNHQHSNHNSNGFYNNQGDLEGQAQEQQQLLLDPIADSQYYDARERAVTEVERTIVELGSLFNRLATMISEQQQLVERVDEDVETATQNANQAQELLAKAYEKVSSNRGMYMKIGGILALFLLFFVLFLL